MLSTLRVLFMTLFLTATLNEAVEQRAEQEVGQTGNTVPPSFDPEVIAELRSAHSGLPEQAAIDIAEMIKTLKEDAQTIELVKKLKEGKGKEVYEDFTKDLSDKEIVASFAQILDEMKATELLFEDPERAVEEMHKDGMIPPGKLDKYRNNPSLLESDTRVSLHFTFVSLAAAGGYL